MKKNGTTSAGRTRWRCGKRGCGASVTHSYDRGAEDVQGFLDWLLSRKTQRDASVPDRTLRRRNGLGWSLWPPCPMDGQVHDVVHLDGIHLGRNAVVLIAYGDGHVLGWYVARRETSAAWENLMARIGRTRGRRVRWGRRHSQGPQARMAARPRATLPVPHLPQYRRHTRHEPAP